MAGRDRIVVRLPRELVTVTRLYQDCRRIVSYSDTIRELIETHPEVVKLVTKLYNEIDREPTTGGLT